MNIRRLDPNEYPLLAVALEGARSDEPLPNPNHSIVLAAENGEGVIATGAAERCWVVSGGWTRKDLRGLGLMELIGQKLMTYNSEGLTEMLITTNPHIESLVYSLGFRPLLGQLWRRGRE